jgi:DNA adenine methylase
VNLLDFLEEHGEAEEVKDKVVKGPFPWPGGKNRSVEHILRHLPYDIGYIEPFGGSGVVLLNRRPSKLEVYNDRFSGVCDFYRCIRDSSLYEKLIDNLKLWPYAREEWEHARDTWVTTEDQVERAAKWWYMVVYSFAAQGRNFGRALQPNAFAGKHHSLLDFFWDVHERFKKVLIENRNAMLLLDEFDDPNNVFYLDPPYVNTDPSCYEMKFDLADHKKLLDKVFSMQSFVAVSGYNNELYKSYTWDEVVTWEKFIPIEGTKGTAGNCKPDGVYERGYETEHLYIKARS